MKLKFCAICQHVEKLNEDNICLYCDGYVKGFRLGKEEERERILKIIKLMGIEYSIDSQQEDGGYDNVIFSDTFIYDELIEKIQKVKK